jgi:DNA-binding MarR family transcriptional regulator
MLVNVDTAGAVTQPLDQGILHGLLGRQLRMTYLAVFRTLEERLTEIGITPQQFGLLVIVDRNPGARQTLIAKARGLDKSTLVPMIDRLERDNLLERRPLATDRRIRAIWMTEHGREVLRKAEPIVQKGDDLIRAHLSDGELSELVRLMEKVRVGLGVAA